MKPGVNDLVDVTMKHQPHALRSEEQTPLIRPRPSPNTRRQFLMGTQPEQNQRERSLNIKRMNHRHINTELTSVFGQKHY